MGTLRRVALFALGLIMVVPVYGQRRAESVESLTQEMQSMRRGGLRSSEFSRIATTRAKLFRRLMETNPRAAVGQALPDMEASRLRDWAPGEVELRGRWQGSLEVRVEDDPVERRSRKRYYLTTAAQEFEVFPASDPVLPGCQPDVAVEGIVLQDAVAAKNIEIRAAGATCSLTGPQNIAVILVNFTNATLPANVTSSFMTNAFFGAGSLDNYWREASYDRTSATGVVLGPFTINVTSCSNSSTIRSLAIAAADSAIDFRNYTRLFIVHPAAGSCSLGLGTIGCLNHSSADGSFTASTVWMRADYLTTTSHVVSLAAHEGGHNFGLQHASTYDFGSTALGPPGVAGTYDEYMDVYSAMGLSFNQSGTIIIGHYNAPQKAALGWLSSGTDYQPVSSNGTFTISPYASSMPGIKALRVARPGTNKWLWIEYRRSLGLFESTLGVYSSNIYNGALIHYDDPNEGNYPESLLLDFTPSGTPNNFRDPTLVAGQTWIDPSTPLRIQVVSATSSALTVSIVSTSTSPCDLNLDGATNIVDVQQSVQKVLGLLPCGNGDVDGNGTCTVVDVQRIVNAVLGGACVTT